MQSAMRCEVDLDTLLDILTLPLDVITQSLSQDAEFCSDNEKTLEQWNPYPLNVETSDVKVV
jgi:hypothetical protein